MIRFLTVGIVTKLSEGIRLVTRGYYNVIDWRMFLLIRLFHEDVAVLPAATLHRQSPVLASEGESGHQGTAHRQHSLTCIHPLRFVLCM